MRSGLQSVRRRVEALDRSFGPTCRQPHTFFRVDSVAGDGSVIPPWPDEETRKECSCGRELQYRRIVNTRQPAGPPTWATAW